MKTKKLHICISFQCAKVEKISQGTPLCYFPDEKVVVTKKSEHSLSGSLKVILE